MKLIVKELRKNKSILQKRFSFLEVSHALTLHLKKPSNSEIVGEVFQYRQSGLNDKKIASILRKRGYKAAKIHMLLKIEVDEKQLNKDLKHLLFE